MKMVGWDCRGWFGKIERRGRSPLSPPLSTAPIGDDTEVCLAVRHSFPSFGRCPSVTARPRHPGNARIGGATARRAIESGTRESRRFRRLAGRRLVGQLGCTKSVYTLWCWSRSSNAASHATPIQPHAIAAPSKECARMGAETAHESNACDRDITEYPKSQVVVVAVTTLASGLGRLRRCHFKSRASAHSATRPGGRLAANLWCAAAAILGQRT